MIKLHVSIARGFLKANKLVKYVTAEKIIETTIVSKLFSINRTLPMQIKIIGMQEKIY